MIQFMPAKSQILDGARVTFSGHLHMPALPVWVNHIFDHAVRSINQLYLCGVNTTHLTSREVNTGLERDKHSLKTRWLTSAITAVGSEAVCTP